MDQLRNDDRNAFNDLIYHHFRRLEQETDRWKREKTTLEATVQGKDAEIEKLKAELAQARATADVHDKEDAARLERTYAVFWRAFSC